MEKFMNTSKKSFKISLALLLFVFLFVPPAYSEDLKKIVVMPFEVFSNHDKTVIRESFYKNLQA